MLETSPRIWQTFILATIVALLVVTESASAQNQSMIPVTPKPASFTQTGAQTSPNGSQVNGGWQAIPGYRVADLNTSNNRIAPGQATSQFYQQPVGFDGFAVQTSPGFGAVNAAYSAPAYQVAQLPQQYAPQQYTPQPQQYAPQQYAPQQTPQLPPAYVPQSYVTPGVQPYPGWGAANTAQLGLCTYQPLWTAQISWLYMKRENSNPFPLLISGGGAPLVSADQLDFGWENGFDVGLSRRYGPNSNFELRYFQIDGWTAMHSAAIVGVNGIVTSPPSPIIGAGTAVYTYESSLHSFEMNSVNRLLINERWRLSLGFRWIELSENLAQTFVVGAPPDASLVIDTNNHLYGLQIGGDGVLFTRGRFSMATWVKGGIYANVADQSTLLSFGMPLLGNGIKKTSAAFVGESGLVADFEILPSVSLVGGYQFVYISGAALAADQLPNMSSVGSGLVPTGLDQSDVVYQGAFFGVDMHW